MNGLLIQLGDDATTRASISETLSYIVSDADDDVLVRQHAAKELGFYSQPAELDILLGVVLDSEDDLDVRVNLLEALRRWGRPELDSLGKSLSIGDELVPFLAHHRR